MIGPIEWDATIRDRVFGQQLAEFCRNWRPSDEREKFDFDRDLNELVHAIMRDMYNEASKPMHAALISAFRLMPVPPILVKEPKS